MIVIFVLVLVVVLALLVVAVPVSLVAMVPVEFLREGHTVGAVVEFDFDAEESLVPVPAQACAAISELRARIVDLPLFRRPVVTGSDPPAAAPDHPVTDSILQACAASAQRVGGAARSGHESAKPLVSMAVGLVVATDGVDGAAHGIAAVEQGRRSLDDLQPLQLGRIDQLAVIARLGRKRACPDAVFHDQHPVPVKTAHDGPGRAGSEAALGDPGADSVVQHFPQRDIGRLTQFMGADRFHALKGFEGRFPLFRSGHRDLIPGGRQHQQEVGFGLTTGLDGHRGGGFGKEAVEMSFNRVSAGRNLLEPVVSIILAEGAPTQLHNRHTGAAQGIPAGLQRDVARQAAVGLCLESGPGRQRKSSCSHEGEQPGSDAHRFLLVS